MKKILTGIVMTAIILWRCNNKKPKADYKPPAKELIYHTEEPEDKPDYTEWCKHIGVSRLYCKSDNK